MWVSYYSFKPDFYIPWQHFFQTGLNFAADAQETGVWSHLITNRSFQVFYGKRYPFIVETVIKDWFRNRILAFAEYGMEARRWHSEHDFAVNPNIGFNKAFIYNDTGNTGELHLIPKQPDNLRQEIVWPRIVKDAGDPLKPLFFREILASLTDGKCAFNDFFNQVRNEANNIPVWKIDDNDILRSIRAGALQWNTRWNERIRGDWFLLRLVNDAESRLQMIVKSVTATSKMNN
jgi:hypothetical protein